MKAAVSFSIVFVILGGPILMAGCGGGGGGGSGTSGTVGVDTPGDTATAARYYIAVRARNNEGLLSAYSRELAANLEPGSRITLSWESPTRSLDGECTSVTGYEIAFGAQSAEYTESVNLNADATSLGCLATSVDPACGDVNTCETEIAVPGI